MPCCFFFFTFSPRCVVFLNDRAWFSVENNKYILRLRFVSSISLVLSFLASSGPLIRQTRTTLGFSLAPLPYHVFFCFWISPSVFQLFKAGVYFSEVHHCSSGDAPLFPPSSRPPFNDRQSTPLYAFFSPSRSLFSERVPLRSCLMSLGFFFFSTFLLIARIGLVFCRRQRRFVWVGSWNLHFNLQKLGSTVCFTRSYSPTRPCFRLSGAFPPVVLVCWTTLRKEHPFVLVWISLQVCSTPPFFFLPFVPTLFSLLPPGARLRLSRYRCSEGVLEGSE